ncbi:universal stress protein [Mycobacterium sp. WMMD1722]|uniref:universal stress protein n=1 Tax=Mycobacterium sp. WMMD1722 TaxID=3404117 RepID=UPI003BF540AE
MKHSSHLPSRAVVVGVDGSRSAVTAALWAVDEAISRDIPLRLLCAIAPQDDPPRVQDAARDLATAEIAVREVFMAVESLERPVKIEVEIVQERPDRALILASRTAEMVCVGALGRDHAAGRRVGSVAATLSRAAHCPVAIIRQHDPVAARGCSVVAELDQSPDSISVLETALQEAHLRGAPLRVLTTWQSRPAERFDPRAVRDNDRLSRAHLERRLERFRRAYPELEVTAVAEPGATADYLARHVDSIQLLVVGQQRGGGLAAVAGPAAQAALHDTNCSVLICERRSAL